MTNVPWWRDLTIVERVYETEEEAEKVHKDHLCKGCGKDLLLYCICEDFDSQHDLKEMERESRYCLEPMEEGERDYGSPHDWENCDWDD